MKEWSICIDESGDFGEYSYHSLYYIITMVFHNQNSSIESEINHLEKELSYLNLSNHCIHTGPIIRKEENYSLMDIRERRRIFKFNDVKIYYDNGQIEVSKILSSVFNAMLPEVVFWKVVPSEYKLFQVDEKEWK